MKIYNSNPTFTPAEINDFLTSLSPKDLAQAIMQAESPEALISSLAAPTLYTLLKDVGAEHAPDLIGAANDAQYEAMLDLEIWQKDRINEAGIWRWQTLIDTPSSLDPLGRMVRIIDKRILAAMVCRYVSAQINEEPTEPPRELNSYTPDQGYTWVHINTGDSDRNRLFGRILAYIFDHDPDYFYRLLYSPQIGTSSTFEEEAFDEHRLRMSSLGFPDAETAAHLNAPLAPEKFLALLKEKGLDPARIFISPFIIPRERASSLEPLNTYMSTALSANPALRTDAEQELTALMNAAHLFYDIPFYADEEARFLVQQVRGAINIGIEQALQHGNLNIDALSRSVSLTDLYRLGIYEIMNLQQLARQLEKRCSPVADAQILTVLALAGQRFPAWPQFLIASPDELSESPLPLPLEHLAQLTLVRDYLTVHGGMTQ